MSMESLNHRDPPTNQPTYLPTIQPTFLPTYTTTTIPTQYCFHDFININFLILHRYTYWDTHFTNTHAEIITLQIHILRYTLYKYTYWDNHFTNTHTEILTLQIHKLNSLYYTYWDTNFTNTHNEITLKIHILRYQLYKYT